MSHLSVWVPVKRAKVALQPHVGVKDGGKGSLLMGRALGNVHLVIHFVWKKGGLRGEYTQVPEQ